MNFLGNAENLQNVRRGSICGRPCRFFRALPGGIRERCVSGAWASSVFETNIKNRAGPPCRQRTFFPGISSFASAVSAESARPEKLRVKIAKQLEPVYPVPVRRGFDHPFSVEGLEERWEAREALERGVRSAPATPQVLRRAPPLFITWVFPTVWREP